MPDHSGRKLATVLFADLVDSTAAAGEQDPERTRARLERFYDAMRPFLRSPISALTEVRHDGVMAAFGGARRALPRPETRLARRPKHSSGPEQHRSRRS